LAIVFAKLCAASEREIIKPYQSARPPSMQSLSPTVPWRGHQTAASATSVPDASISAKSKPDLPSSDFEAELTDIVWLNDTLNTSLSVKQTVRGTLFTSVPAGLSLELVGMAMTIRTPETVKMRPGQYGIIGYRITSDNGRYHREKIVTSTAQVRPKPVALAVPSGAELIPEPGTGLTKERTLETTVQVHAGPQAELALPSSVSEGLIDELERLSVLFRDGLLSAEEFTTSKQRLLNP